MTIKDKARNDILRHSLELINKAQDKRDANEDIDIDKLLEKLSSAICQVID